MLPCGVACGTARGPLMVLTYPRAPPSRGAPHRRCRGSSSLLVERSVAMSGAGGGPPPVLDLSFLQGAILLAGDVTLTLRGLVLLHTWRDASLALGAVDGRGKAKGGGWPVRLEPCVRRLAGWLRAPPCAPPRCLRARMVVCCKIAPVMPTARRPCTARRRAPLPRPGHRAQATPAWWCWKTLSAAAQCARPRPRRCRSVWGGAVLAARGVCAQPRREPATAALAGACAASPPPPALSPARPHTHPPPTATCQAYSPLPKPGGRGLAPAQRMHMIEGFCIPGGGQCFPGPSLHYDDVAVFIASTPSETDAARGGARARRWRLRLCCCPGRLLSACGAAGWACTLQAACLRAHCTAGGRRSLP